MSKLLKLLQEEKELNITHRNLVSRKYHEKAIKYTIIKYKKIIFGVDRPISIKLLDELKKQQVINKKVYDQKLMNDALRKLTW